MLKGASLVSAQLAFRKPPLAHAAKSRRRRRMDTECPGQHVAPAARREAKSTSFCTSTGSWVTRQGSAGGGPAGVRERLRAEVFDVERGMATTS
jgi:hypothetical protein